MKNSNLFLFVIALFAMMVYMSSIAEGRESETTSTPEAFILEPGMSSGCQNDFVIENLSESEAELKITLGDEDWITNRIKSRESKAYSLEGAQRPLDDKNVFDDVATVFNTDKNARFKMYCKEYFEEALEPG